MSLLSPKYKALLKKLLIKHEGLVCKIYKCSVGKNTIGVGRNLDAQGLSIKEVECFITNNHCVDGLLKNNLNMSEIRMLAIEIANDEHRIKQLCQGGITTEEALYLLDNDIEAVESQITNNIHFIREVDDIRKVVLCDMAFNLGMAGLLKFKNMLQAVASENYSVAADEMLHSKWAQQVGQRAIDLANMMRHGE
ncbi:glycoside hydrolase family protein [Shewanella surugensis]|uniref:Lysozyme n=1 Tax=Shewanella surugensis TaxID=212020 RepID=A0ABT0LEF9_9GAMM|nr:glycoside hydrolase family protein [Shewanella surugensis]MCL1126091.1 glycoside hydrolase family protein [Shewanella surugensis]